MSPDDKGKAVELTFRFKYIILPLAILLLVSLLTAIFYPRLSLEVAYRFNLSGSPESWLNRKMVLLFALLPQLLLFIIAVAITWWITRTSRSIGQISSALKPERILMLMGNLVALPQIVFGFVMLDVFIYNLYDHHLMPIWLFASTILLIGGIVLGIFFLQAFKRSRDLKQ